MKDEISKSNLSNYSHYFFVKYVNDRPEDIFIIKQGKSKSDISKPFKVIYQWTGKGFAAGKEYSKDIIEFSSDIAQSTPVVEPPLHIISTVPGYIIGTTIFIAT